MHAFKLTYFKPYLQVWCAVSVIQNSPLNFNRIDCYRINMQALKRQWYMFISLRIGYPAMTLAALLPNELNAVTVYSSSWHLVGAV